MARISSHRKLRHLRALLALLATGTAFSIVMAARFESTVRAVAAVAALACVVAWLLVLEAEGRMAERLERRGTRRRLGLASRPAARATPRREPARRVA
jgi:hypothetical protein